MKPRQLVAPREAVEIFDRAVQERALAVLTLQDARGWQTFKSRFLERDPKGRFFVLDYQPADHQPLPPLAPGQYLGVTFRQRSRKLLFATVVEAKGRFVLDDQTSVPAIRYRWPDSITELQRRAYYRTPVPDHTTLLASLWAGGVAARAAAQGSPLGVVTGQVADLSCGGALIRLHSVRPPEWSGPQTLGVEIQLPDGRPPILVDALPRGLRSEDSGSLTVAVQFVGLEVTVDGRVVLQRLANSVQRLHRLALGAGRGDRNSELSR
jgi:c-di-GMP-binding flagellar brake protein YcgR